MFTFLLLQNYKLAQVATWLTSCYSYGTTLLWNLFSTEPEGLAAARGTQDVSWAAARRQTWPARLHGIEEADGQQVCLRLGSIEETEANHTVYNTPDSPVQQFCCICVSFVRIPKDEKLSCLSHQKLTAECEVGGL